MIIVSTEVSSENKREKLTEKIRRKVKLLIREEDQKMKDGSKRGRPRIKEGYKNLRRSLEEVKEGDNHQLGLK